MLISYEEYLSKTNKQDKRESWIDWKTEICGLRLDEATKAAYDPEWGFEPISMSNR